MSEWVEEPEHEPDQLDLAARITDEARSRAEAAVRARVQHGDWRLLSAKWCEGEDCGERIPDARRQAVPGVRLCVWCQEKRERM